MRADARRNRDKVLAAAQRVFGREGPEAQMDDVARCAGVGVGTVYRHFPTKEALMGELVRQNFVFFVTEAEVARSAPGSAFALLAGLLRAHAERLAGDAATRYAMASGTAVWDAARRERLAWGVLVDELIARGRADGTLRDDLSVSDIPMIMCGLCSSMDRGFDWARLLELALDGMRGRPAA
jgi:AcrR family transcriptional regulator